MEGWFKVLFRIPFTVYWIARETEGLKRFLVVEKKFGAVGVYYFEAI